MQTIISARAGHVPLRSRGSTEHRLLDQAAVTGLEKGWALGSVPFSYIVIEVGFGLVIVHWLAEVQAHFLAAVLLNQYSAAQN